MLFAEQQSQTDVTLKETLLLSPVGNKLSVFDLTKYAKPINDANLAMWPRHCPSRTGPTSTE